MLWKIWEWWVADKLWHWSGRWIGFGRTDADLLPGWKLGWGTLSWCSDWRTDLRDRFTDDLLEQAEKRKGEKR